VADRRIAHAIVAAFVGLLSACASQVTAPPAIERQGPPDFPEAYYQRLSAQGKPVFRIDPARSLVVIEVRRSGSLAQFGHDHVVASHDVAGYIAPSEARADLYVPLDALVVDEPALRAEARFDTQPSAGDIAGTRSNMLEKVLETARFPYAVVSVNSSVAGSTAQQIPVAVTLHGVTRPTPVEARFDQTGKDVSVTGSMAIDQSQFGIALFSILGGAIAVQDRVTITFRILGGRPE